MNLILCIDEKGGMAFNHRRQSRDKKQRLHLYSLVGDSSLTISPYSEKLIVSDDTDIRLQITSDLTNADPDSFVWVEIDSANSLIPMAKQIILYKWNRLYLSDLRFDESLLTGFSLMKTEQIKGSSHERIDIEYYERIISNEA